jgi:hypothetical protein
MKVTALVMIAISICTTLNAQDGCSAYSLQKGDVLTFTRLLPPPYDPAIAKLKNKEKLEYIRKQNEDINNGTLKLRDAQTVINITERTNNANGFIVKAHLLLINPGNTYDVPYIYECANDTLFLRPEEQYKEIEGVGVTYTSPVIFPMKMKKGDLLPDNKTVTVTYKRTGSNKMLLPYISKITTTHYLDYDGTELYKTVENTLSNKEVTNSFSSIATLETIYANREVTGDTVVSYKGKNYKGFIITCYLLNTTSVEVESNYLQKSMERLTNRKLAKAQRKLADDESGLFTTLIQDIFVPELGVVSTLITKKDGSFFSKSTLVN